MLLIVLFVGFAMEFVDYSRLFSVGSVSQTFDWHFPMYDMRRWRIAFIPSALSLSRAYQTSTNLPSRSYNCVVTHSFGSSC